MLSLLIVTSITLGLLAFFEPCSIATHTLFSAKASKENKKNCCWSLLGVWLSRSILMVVLLVSTVLLTPVPQWNNTAPSIILSIMAGVYLLSRLIYIPLPHLDFFKLLPGNKHLPYSIKLGLSLPACTLPLIIVIAGMSITLNSPGVAAISGVLFSSLFTLPMAFASYRGLNKNTLDLLSQAASRSSYLTAILLLALALYLLLPSLDINIDELKQVLDKASWAGIGLGFLAGFVFSFNPVSFASIPVVLAYVTTAHEEKRARIMGGAFVSGMLLTHVALGISAALGGEWVQSIMGRHWGLFLGPILIILGLIWAGWLNIRLSWFGMKARKVSSLWGAFLLGIPFSVAVCPFCTPALLVTLTASAAIGSVSFGFALLLAFALGRSIPIILGAISIGWIESLQIFSRYQRIFEVISGLTLIISGLYLLNEYFYIL